MKEDVIIGCDVARKGSASTVAIVRQGRRVLRVEAWQGKDLMETTGRLIVLAREYRSLGHVEINVDDIGVGGGVTDRLEEQGYPVNPVIVGVPARDSERFTNLRAELFFALACRFRDGDIDIPPYSNLMSQLASLRYEIDSRGRIKIESKENMAKRGVASPDYADALMLAFADQTPGIFGYYRDMVEGAMEQAQRPVGNPPTPAELARQESEPKSDLYAEYEQGLRELEAAMRRPDWNGQAFEVAPNNETPASEASAARRAIAPGRPVTDDPGYVPPGFKRTP